jgi:hypothetical protein
MYVPPVSKGRMGVAKGGPVFVSGIPDCCVFRSELFQRYLTAPHTLDYGRPQAVHNSRGLRVLGCAWLYRRCSANHRAPAPCVSESWFGCIDRFALFPIFKFRQVMSLDIIASWPNRRTGPRESGRRHLFTDGGIVPVEEFDAALLLAQNG